MGDIKLAMPLDMESKPVKGLPAGTPSGVDYAAPRAYVDSEVTNAKSRANHTGTQTASTVSDFDTQVRTNRLDQLAAPTAAVSANSQRLTSLADPSGAQDAATKNYVDLALAGVVAGLDLKDPVRVATTANITLSGTQTIDGIGVVAGDRVLVKNQSTASGNGLYLCAAGAWSRTTDADASAEVTNGLAVVVQNGTINANTLWVLGVSGAVTLGTTSLTFSQLLGGSGGQSFVANIGDGSSTTIAVPHNLGTRDVRVEVYRNSSPWDTIGVAPERPDTNTVNIVFASAPTSAQFRALVTKVA